MVLRAREAWPPPTLNIGPVTQPVYVPRPGRPWTIDDLYRLADDENRYELVQGDLLMMSPASPVQGRFAVRLIQAIASHVDEHYLGEVYTCEPGFVLQPEPDAVIRVPDVAFVRTERIPPPEEQAGFWNLAPDLAVEVISPSETAAEIQAKVRDYLAAGTALIWLVYPQTQTVVEYRSLREIVQYGLDDTLEGGDVLPGFRYPLSRLFRERNAENA